MRYVSLLLSIFTFFGCAGPSVDSESISDSKLVCPSGIGAQMGDAPKISTKTRNGHLIVCGYLNKKLTDNVYDMSEFDVYSLSGEHRSHLLQIESVENRVIEIQPNGDLRLIEKIYASSNNSFNLFSRTVSCSETGCEISPKNCLLKRDVGRYRKPIVLVKNKRWLLEKEDGQLQLFLAALHGYKSAQEAFDDPQSAKMDGHIGETFEARRKILREAQEICK